MSVYLWKYYLEDDVESFRQVLEEATYAGKQHTQRGNTRQHTPYYGAKIGSPGSFSVSPLATSRQHREGSVPTFDNGVSSYRDITLTRADLNRRDGKGVTLLHLAASSQSANANSFAMPLISHPLIDLYVQDHESGWTALHRAIYAGNVTIARAIIEKDFQYPALPHLSLTQQNAGLIKIKDKEGNGPYDLLGATIKDRTLRHRQNVQTIATDHSGDEDDGDGQVQSSVNDDGDEVHRKIIVKPLIDVRGEECLTFGSNRNITLGFGDEDDRHFPERIRFDRPQYLFKRFHAEFVAERISEAARTSSAYAAALQDKSAGLGDRQALPAVVQYRPASILDVQMAKFHTIVLTNDPEANVYVCGHGLGGRLGTGSEKTQFNLKCIDELAATHKKFVGVALGQDHTLAISEFGEVYTWGSNAHGQLGCGMPKANHKPEELVQMLPKQLFGPLKREVVIGAAASRTHSVVHTATSLFTFGKNEGQLGIVDAHAGTLEIQSVPRKVAASRFSSPICAVAAIDRATVCLLHNRDVHVFANYGIVKLVFPLDGFANYFLKTSFSATKYDKIPNRICKITAGGDTICALSTTGEVFTVNVDQRVDPESSIITSTTKPNKIKAALSTPHRLWSLKKGYMAARDVGVEQDGSIILSTEAGSVWRRVRRAKLTNASMSAVSDAKPKDYKFSRVPNLTRVLAVRASSSGAYCAIRSDCDVTRTQILVDPQTLWKDAFALLSFRKLANFEDSDTENPQPRFWRRPSELDSLVATLLQVQDLEKEMKSIFSQPVLSQSFPYDAVIQTTVSEVGIPIHQSILASRSCVLRDGFAICQHLGSWSNDFVSIQREPEGRLKVSFQGVDFLTLVELGLYMHTDAFVGFWLHTRRAQNMAFRYRAVRTELMKCAAKLEMANLESSVRRMSPTAAATMGLDMEVALMDGRFLESGDTLIQLADGELRVHGVWLSQRCHFFEGLFVGRASGRWLTERRDLSSEDGSNAIKVDMQHVNMKIFKLVLRHMYADTGEELFDDIVAGNLDEFLDLVMDVLSVANELMLDRLSQICQMVIGRYVNVRNVCSLLNAISPSAVHEFKDSALEYLCLSLETVLSNHLIDELDEDLLEDLDAIVKDNQLGSMPIVRSGRADQILHDKYPALAEMMDRGRQAKIDAISLQVKFADQYIPFGTSSHDGLLSTTRQTSRRPSQQPSTAATPIFDGRSSASMSKLGREDELMLPLPATLDANASISSPFSATEVIGPSLTDVPSTPSPTGHTFRASPAASSQAALSGSTSRPWGVAPLQSNKLSIREMLEQSSTPRESNLSLGLRAKSTSEDAATSSGGLKVSQKERRRQQQLRQDSQTARLLGTLEGGEITPAVPWQAVTSSKKTVKETLLAPAPVPSPSPRPLPTPQMTLRQTVANSPVSAKSTTMHSSPKTPVQARTSSSPQVVKTLQPAGLTASSSSSAATPIQSIRHVPLSPQAISPTFLMHQSMADILSQQESEKTSIREAAAKRSLQEIQQEQEFQQWWEQESRKVMEEQQAASSSSLRNPNVSAGRGKSQGAPRGRARARKSGEK